MYQIKKSSLFMQQWQSYTLSYKERASIKIAQRFIEAVEHTLTFIAENPLACTIYKTNQRYDDLAVYTFRKHPLKNFPHSIFFRMATENSILVEALYAHKMNISHRLPSDIS